MRVGSLWLSCDRIMLGGGSKFVRLITLTLPVHADQRGTRTRSRPLPLPGLQRQRHRQPGALRPRGGRSVRAVVGLAATNVKPGMWMHQQLMVHALVNFCMTSMTSWP